MLMTVAVAVLMLMTVAVAVVVAVLLAVRLDALAILAMSVVVVVVAVVMVMMVMIIRAVRVGALLVLFATLHRRLRQYSGHSTAVLPLRVEVRHQGGAACPKYRIHVHAASLRCHYLRQGVERCGDGLEVVQHGGLTQLVRLVQHDDVRALDLLHEQVHHRLHAAALAEIRPRRKRGARGVVRDEGGAVHNGDEAVQRDARQ
mmetsp:Transcript_17512/g.45538  ORF Transcript_17512/g.45538 Transcript_17512/m.45538 type:complete len:202 (+) Transcript_17512:1-606(+)